ncbi:MAG: helix-turn-helix transcriptional regulator [Sandaracinus sp.]|nr:helix-turn-helix transcriptional regulator [Sandaracinus sp.]
MELFRAHGFAGTSTQRLVETLDVNRNSLYSEFGSKQALFDAALRRYDQIVVTEVFGALEAPDAGLATIAALFDGFAAAAAGASSGLGCLLCNTAVELGGADPSGAGFVARYFDRVQRAFVHALDNARRAGDLAPAVDTVDEARLLTATTLGIFVLVRARAAPQTVQGAARVLRRNVEALRSQAA